LGRTAAFFGMTAGGATVTGALLGGLFGDWLGVRETLGIAVAGIAVAPVFILFSPLARLREIPIEPSEPRDSAGSAP
jgi:predicted MFS family arabinose efflux permease